MNEHISLYERAVKGNKELLTNPWKPLVIKSKFLRTGRNMTDTNWKKLKKNLRGEAYSDAIIDALESNLIGPTDAKIFLNPKNDAYGLVLPKLEEELKAVFQKHTGFAFPETGFEGMEKVAYETLCNVLANNTETYGPSFSMYIDETEILVTTEKAVKALGLNPSDIKNTNLRVPSETKQSEALSLS